MSKKGILTISILVGIISLLLLSYVLLVGNAGDVKIGYILNTADQTMAARFTYMDGKEEKKIRTAAGESWFIYYQLEAEEGTLELQILDKNKEVIEQRQDEAGVIELGNEQQKQSYLIRVRGSAAKGSFNIEWQQSE